MNGYWLLIIDYWLLIVIWLTLGYKFVPPETGDYPCYFWPCEHRHSNWYLIWICGLCQTHEFVLCSIDNGSRACTYIIDSCSIVYININWYTSYFYARMELFDIVFHLFYLKSMTKFYIHYIFIFCIDLMISYLISYPLYVFTCIFNG